MPQRNRSRSELPKHVLVIRLSAMGDVAMCVPVIRCLRLQYPETRITVVTRKLFVPFFRDIDGVGVFVADVKARHKGILGLNRMSKEVRELGVDAVADLHAVLRSHILRAFLWPIFSRTIDKGRAEKKALIRGQKFEQLQSTHERYADVFRNLGFHISIESDEAIARPVELSAQLKSKLNWQEIKPHIGIAPFAKHRGKMYPLEQMKQIVKELAKRYQLFLFGGRGEEAELMRQWASESANISCLAGELMMEEELDVISNLDVMLAMDSGNAHLAANYGVKVVTIWGVTHPYAGFYPFRQNTANALLADRKKYPLIPTSVYGNKLPPGYEHAASTVSISKVIDKIEANLR